jgi:hypothetical protein
MKTNESWDEIAKVLTPILSKTEYSKKKNKKKNLKFLLIAGGIAILLWFIGAYWVYKLITG